VLKKCGAALYANDKELTISVGLVEKNVHIFRLLLASQFTYDIRRMLRVAGAAARRGTEAFRSLHNFYGMLGRKTKMTATFQAKKEFTQSSRSAVFQTKQHSTIAIAFSFLGTWVKFDPKKVPQTLNGHNLRPSVTHEV